MREKAPETYEEKLAQLRELRQEAIHNAGQVAVDKQHAKGKFTARERIAWRASLCGADAPGSAGPRLGCACS